MALFWQKGNNATNATESKPEKVSKKPVVKKAPKAVAVSAKKVAAKDESTATKREAAVKGVVFPAGSAVIRPRITEKSGLLSQKGIYTFDVLIDAVSSQIEKSITEAYKVTPTKISISPVRAKGRHIRGKAGRTAKGKKAYVYLKKGETIEFI